MLHRHARPAVAGSFFAGAVVGALATALMLAVGAGLLTPVPIQWRAGVAVCALVLLALRQAGIVCLGLPQRAWQIPREVFDGDVVRGSFAFALHLGSGVRTYVTTSAPYAVALVILLVSPSGFVPAVTAAGMTAVGFGIGRSLVIAVQPITRRAAVEHPAVAMALASWLSIAGCLVLAVHAFRNA